jgi:ribosome biogenesis GTPase
VVALEANFCRVALESAGPGGVDQLLCVRRTRLGKTGQQICVGDRVTVEGVDWISRRGAVAAVAELPAACRADRGSGACPCP